MFTSAIIGNNINRGADTLEIYNKEKDNYISVWMTKEDQQLFDRQALSDLLLSTVKTKNAKSFTSCQVMEINTPIPKICS